MEQGIVKNTSDADVEVMWDGMQVFFRAGQQRVFPIGIARGIVNESEALSIVEEEKEVKVSRVDDEKPAEKNVEPNFTTRTTKKGIVQYLKDGKICSKDDYEAR
jgi:acylphosphatase